MTESVFAREQREAAERRRAWSAFLMGLPAVVVAILTIVVLVEGIRMRRGGEIRSHYLDAAKAAVEAKDWPSAEILSRKVVNLRPGDPVGRYLAALCAEGTGDLPRARRLMTQLAPTDRPGFAAAHWWIVRELSKQSETLSVKQAHEMRDHLRHFLATHEDHAEARMLLGQAELALGEVEWALEEMRLATKIDPNYCLAAGRVAARVGREVEARTHIEQACEFYKQQVRKSPSDVASRLRWVDCLTMQGDFRSAGDVLLRGLDYENDPRLCAGLVQLSITTYDVLDQQEKQDADTFSHQLALIERSLSLAPNHRPLLERLARMSTSSLDVAGDAAALLRPRLEAGTVPTSVWMVLGNEALKRGDYETARHHLEAALQRQPDYGVSLNNLAWAFAHGRGADLDRAMGLVDRAIALQPERGEFRETRGQILAQLGRYDEAVADLKCGLEFPGTAETTQATLADVYDAMGEIEQAAYYREKE